MKEKIAAIGDWLEHRTGAISGIQHFLYEEIPASSGWHQVFGSVALFLFMVQAFTGIMLAFNYAPTPGEAYSSLRYILTELTAGRLIRGLHHWGASMMIVVVGLHLVQVALYGAYKKPRESTWIVGVVLLLVTLAFGLTGYLLPWDNRAYWGTMVTTQIAGSAPIMGPYITRLMGAGAGGVSVVTFARFYALHVTILPPAIILLIALHVFLVRKHGVTPAPGDELLPKKGFFPVQVFKDTVAIFIAFAILFTMAVAVRVPLEQVADPTDTSYIPRPEWYFLFLFQTLKLFNGPLEVVGAVVLPGLAVTLLILLPFIDRAQMVKVTKRTVAMAVIALAAIGWTGLTAAAVASTPKEAGAVPVDYADPTDWMQLSPDNMVAVATFRQAGCANCHGIGNGAAKGGPDLSRGTIHRTSDWLTQHIKQSSSGLSDQQIAGLANFMLKLNPENVTALQYAPAFAVAGAQVYQQNHCNACHMVNGTGGKLGPALNGLSKHQTRGWVEEHFVDPQKMSPGTVMPSYKFSANDMHAITSYLFSLPAEQQ